MEYWSLSLGRRGKRKELEFLSLSQGDMSVDAYEAELNALSQYAPDMVSDEEKRV